MRNQLGKVQGKKDAKGTQLSTLSFDAGFSHDADFLALQAQNTVSANLSIVDLSMADMAMAGITSGITPSCASAAMQDLALFDKPCEKVILTVGNSMMGDDGAGPCLAQKMMTLPIEGWVVIDGGTIPEDNIHILRRLQPKMLVLVDAAEMSEKAGTVRIIDPDTIADMFIMSTHSLPLNFLLDELKLFIPRVEFIGVQPAIVAFSFPMTEMVKSAVEEIYQALQKVNEVDALLPSAWSE
ncbi:hydrogenase 3 maturation protease [Psychromonas sp. CNPT3]|uniref:hydrogenase maturation peptidase HycI n=1 Tax=Psychromonas sp. CNPT3 TaxID=314282 RepID=UPI00006E892D|nr:hydrogenase maturation peptidase HycI [Psychromonas sp. CNPT3]AGH82383.1 hydrogenase 3 maturation protease [Psychromonas sp. CNPT3]